MRDVVTNVAPTSGRSGRMIDAMAELSHRASGDRRATDPLHMDSLTQRWDSAVETAAQRRWSVAPPRSVRCSEGRAHGSIPIGAGPPVTTGGVRARRNAPLAHVDFVTVPTDASVDTVVSDVAPGEWSIRTEYTLAQALRALSSCRAPFTEASRIVDELFSVATHPRYTAEQRVLLRSVATIIDQLAALASQVFVLQSVCNLFRIVADILDGNPVAASDAMDVNTLNRYVISLKRADRPLAALGKAFSTRQERPGGADIGAAIGVPRHAGDAAADLPEGAGSVAAGATGQEAGPAADGRLPPHETVARVPPGPARTTLEMRYGEAGDPLVEAAPEAPNYGGAEGAPVLAMPAAEDAAIRDIVAGVAPARLQWTHVQTVPIRRNTRMKTHWEPFALSDYRVADVDLRERAEGEVFEANGQRYLHLDGYALAVRAFQAGTLWVVDHRLATDGTYWAGDRNPPMPLRRNGNRWELARPPIKDVRPDGAAVVGQDGFFRYRNRKFVTLADARVEVPRAVIDGEHTLAGLAHAIHDPMPGGNAMQIIRLPDGSHWIEGGLGYYRLRFDLDVHEFYVTDAEDRHPASRVLVDFDIQRRKWGVLSIGQGDDAEAGFAQHDPARSAGMSVAVDAPAASPDGDASAADAGRAGIEASRARFDEVGVAAQSGQADRFDDWGVEEAAFGPDADSDPRMQEGGSEGHAVGLPAFVSDKTGLDREFALFAHYAQHLKHFAFFFTAQPAPYLLQRRALRHRLKAAFNGLEATAMVAVNRMEPSLRQKLTPTVLSLRRRILGLYPPDRLWRGMTVQEKQYEVGLMIQQAYRQTRSEMWPCLQGYCNEIADLTLNALTSRNTKLRRNLLQIAIRDEDGIRSSHVMVAYADEPAAFDVLADLSERDLRAQRTAPTLDEAAFCEWLLQNRDNVLLIDAWSTHKIIDLTAAKSVADVRGELLPNLMEAGFDVYGSPRFTVRALLPERPARAFSPLLPAALA